MRLSSFIAPLPLSSQLFFKKFGYEKKTEINTHFMSACEKFNGIQSIANPQSRSMRDIFQSTSMGTQISTLSNNEQAQLHFLFEELVEHSEWTLSRDRERRELISGNIDWVNFQCAGKFETEKGALSQLCNPILARIADRCDIPYPTGIGITRFHIILIKKVDEHIQLSVKLIE